MSEIERNESRSRVKAMTDEEQELAAKCLPTSVLMSEINRRSEKAAEVLTDVLNITNKINEQMSLEDMQAMIWALKKTVRGGREHEQ